LNQRQSQTKNVGAWHAVPLRFWYQAPGVDAMSDVFVAFIPVENRLA
jgi:hypothetical protein